MYLRDLIKISGISGPIYGVEGYLTHGNSAIKSIEKSSKNTLVVSLTKKNGNLEGKVRIKLQADDEKNILERILFSNKVIGKTLNELGDIKFEDL